MNPALFWTLIGGGMALLVAVVAVVVLRTLRTRRREALRAALDIVPRGALDVAVTMVGVFLVLIGAALLAGAATRVLVVWLVVLLAVGLLCTVFRSQPGRSTAPAHEIPHRPEVLAAATRMLERADFHQVSVARLAVSVADAPQLAAAFGPGEVEAVRTALAQALLQVVPPDGLLWAEDHDRVVALVRQEECDLTAWRAQVESILVTESTAHVPTTTWRTTSTDDRGYRLEGLEADEQTAS